MIPCKEGTDPTDTGQQRTVCATQGFIDWYDMLNKFFQGDDSVDVLLRMDDVPVVGDKDKCREDPVNIWYSFQRYAMSVRV